MPEILDPAEVDTALVDRDIAWQRRDAELVKVVNHRDFATALAYVNKVGSSLKPPITTPDVDIRWGTVTLRLSTHSAGGLTSVDLRLAAAIDALPGGR